MDRTKDLQLRLQERRRYVVQKYTEELGEIDKRIHKINEFVRYGNPVSIEREVGRLEEEKNYLEEELQEIEDARGIIERDIAELHKIKPENTPEEELQEIEDFLAQT